jgi:low affinity Fe/Cu permease
MHLLKSWFVTASSNEEIGIRHKVVNELNPLVDWRQKIQAHGKNSKNKKENEQAFFSWLGGG